jgi:hypothetical protein
MGMPGIFPKLLPLREGACGHTAGTTSPENGT